MLKSYIWIACIFSFTIVSMPEVDINRCEMIMDKYNCTKIRQSVCWWIVEKYLKNCTAKIFVLWKRCVP